MAPPILPPATLESPTSNASTPDFLKRLVRLGPKGDVELTADFGDFKTGDDGWLPRRFELQSPAGAWRTSVQINKLERNPFLIEKNFALETTFSAKTESCQ